MNESITTQRQMLENAAKTMGLTLIWSADDDVSPRAEGSRLVFNPHLSDGVAYRLLVANNIILSFAGGPPSFANKGAAGRAAILWIAAERGKSILVSSPDDETLKAANRSAPMTVEQGDKILSQLVQLNNTEAQILQATLAAQVRTSKSK